MFIVLSYTCLETEFAMYSNFEINFLKSFKKPLFSLGLFNFKIKSELLEANLIYQFWLSVSSHLFPNSFLRLCLYYYQRILIFYSIKQGRVKPNFIQLICSFKNYVYIHRYLCVPIWPIKKSRFL